jgi:hypothetical protein
MRRSMRRVRDGGADAVAPSVEKLRATLARMVAAGEARASDYDMVITYALRSWQEHGGVCVCVCVSVCVCVCVCMCVCVCVCVCV